MKAVIMMAPSGTRGKLVLSELPGALATKNQLAAAADGGYELPFGSKSEAHAHLGGLCDHVFWADSALDASDAGGLHMEVEQMRELPRNIVGSGSASPFPAVFRWQAFWGLIGVKLTLGNPFKPRL